MNETYSFDKPSAEAIAATVREHQATPKNDPAEPWRNLDTCPGQQVFLGVTTVNSEYPSYPANSSGNDTFAVAITHSIHDEVVPTSTLASHDLGNYVYAKQIDGTWVAQNTRVIVFSVPTSLGPRWWFITAPATTRTGFQHYNYDNSTDIANTATDLSLTSANMVAYNSAMGWTGSDANDEFTCTTAGNWLVSARMRYRVQNAMETELLVKHTYSGGSTDYGTNAIIPDMSQHSGILTKTNTIWYKWLYDGVEIDDTIAFYCTADLWPAGSTKPVVFDWACWFEKLN